MRGPILRSGNRKPAGWSLIWLAYLGIYFIPWFAHAPSTREIVASLTGVSLFLLVYFDAYLGRRRSIVPHAVVMAGIGYALSPFGGVWSVLDVFAASLLAGSLPRRQAIFAMGVLCASLLVFALVFRVPWYNWAPAIFFGAMASLGNLLSADLQRRNQQLLETQDEVRALSAVAERERIARDLHDLLGHTLTLVAVKADLATRLAERDPEAARREMQAVAQVAREALSQVRDAVTGMTGLTFAGEVERAKSMLAAASVDVRVNTPADLADPKREAVLAMALREAVTNVIRHADAKLCSIDLQSDPNGDLRLQVADDGRGGAFEEGSGLRGMRARLFAAGGALEVHASSSGALLTATLPRRAAA
jgi:two-component system sensor histidine kinase DesK